MNEKSPSAARAERMAKALRANLRRRKGATAGPDGPEGEGQETLERRSDPLAPRMEIKPGAKD